MSKNHSNDELLEAFLDGQLSAEEKLRADKVINEDPDLIEQARLQRRIDDSLERLFAPDSVAPTLSRLKSLADADREADSNLQLEAFLDGQLPENEAARVRQQTTDSQETAEQVQLLNEIDNSLKRLYGPAAEVPSLQNQRHTSTPKVRPASQVAQENAAPNRTRQRLTMIAAALAACLAWVMVVGQLGPGEDRSAYEPIEFAMIYDDCVDDGYKPLWVCKNEEEFASTFEKRQGVRVRVASLPEGRSMAGLSYLEGLSPNATTLLAKVDDQPVLVMVTSAAEDPRRIAEGSEELNVHRVERLGLAFYEVSPFDEALIAPFFELAEGAAE